MIRFAACSRLGGVVGCYGQKASVLRHRIGDLMQLDRSPVARPVQHIGLFMQQVGDNPDARFGGLGGVGQERQLSAQGFGVVA